MDQSFGKETLSAPPVAGFRRVRWGLRTCGAVIAVLLALAAVLSPWPVRADEAGHVAGDVFTVSNVKVDVTADTAAHARDEAIEEGQRRALNRLFDRLVLAADRDRVPKVSKNMLANLVRDFEVSNEKTSTVRYLATLTIRFKQDAVRKFLRDAGVGFAETRSKPVLVLPVYEVSGARALWDTPNPWRAAWDKLPPSDGLVPLILPHGDLRDMSLIGAEQAVRGNDQRLAAIAQRYGAADVLVVRAGIRVPAPAKGAPAQPPYLQVTINRRGTAQLEQTRVETFHVRPGEDPGALLDRAAAAVAAGVEEDWKRDNRLRFNEGSELTVQVPVSSLGEWLKIKRRLDVVALIRRSDLIYLSSKVAELRLNFIGDKEQLRLALLQSDLKLDHGATSWVLTLSGGRESEAPVQ